MHPLPAPAPAQTRAAPRAWFVRGARFASSVLTFARFASSRGPPALLSPLPPLLRRPSSPLRDGLHEQFDVEELAFESRPGGFRRLVRGAPARARGEARADGAPYAEERPPRSGHLRHEVRPRHGRVRGGVERDAPRDARGVRDQGDEGDGELPPLGRRGLRRGDQERDRGHEEARAPQRDPRQGVLRPERQVLHRHELPPGRRAPRRAAGPGQLQRGGRQDHREAAPGRVGLHARQQRHAQGPQAREPLLARPNDISSVVIADFGLARNAKTARQVFSTQCGTPSYVAPEILLGKPYTPAVDV